MCLLGELRRRSAPDARHYFLLSCQKKVSKEKSRPQRRPAAPGALRCSAATGGCGTRTFGPQTVLAPLSVASCAARRRKGLIENRTHINRMWCQVPFGVLFLPPRAAPSNGVRPGAVGEDCLRAKPEFRPAGSTLGVRSPPVVAEQRRAPGESRATLWARFFFGYFLLARQKKVRPRVRRGTQR